MVWDLCRSTAVLGVVVVSAVVLTGGAITPVLGADTRGHSEGAVATDELALTGNARNGRALRAVMCEFGDGRKPIIATECIGYGTFEGAEHFPWIPPVRTDESITVAKKVAGTLRVPFSAHGVCGLLWKTRHLLIRRS
jgi:hypothetical protein